MRPLKDRCVVLGITGGIAAYKAADLVSRLKKMGADVKVIMTRSAAEFIAPLTLQSLSQNQVAMDMFEEPRSWEIRHISLAQSADVFVIAPCTANVIGKIAGGLADDLLTTTVMATKAPVLIAPAMNTNMYENPIVQQNIQKLTSLGYTFIAPESGRLACGDIGRGKLADPAHIAEYVQIAALRPSGDLRGRRILVTAGATQEALDPVRYLTNHSSGKMGYAVANAAYLRGADVVLVSAPSQQAALPGVTVLPVVSAREMYAAVMEQAPDADAVIKAAAVADFRPAEQAGQKLKKSGIASMELQLTANPDILQELGDLFGGKKVIAGFCMETQDLLARAKEKLARKGADFIVANDLTTAGAGFGTDTNVVTILSADGSADSLPLMEKDAVANELLDRIAAKL